MLKIILVSVFMTFLAQAKIKSMKGWELYYLEQKSEKSFVLIEGTNSLKNPQELKQNKLTLEELEQHLTNLDSKEFVALSNRFASLSNTIPMAEKSKIEAICMKNNLNCFLGE